MKEFFTSIKTWVIGGVLALAALGIDARNDSRYVQLASFDEYVEQGIVADLKAEIRYLRREIQALEADLNWESDPAHRAAIESQLNYLKIELQELEEELEVYR